MTRFDFITWQHVDAGTLPPLRELVKESVGKPTESIVVDTIIAEAAEPFATIRPRTGNFHVRHIGAHAAMLVEDPSGPFVLLALATQHDGVFHLVGSIPATDKRWKKVERWVNADTNVTPCFLDHDDFADIGTALSEFGDVEVRALSARKREDRSSYNRGWPARAGALRPDHFEAIDEAEGEQASVRTLTLHVGETLDVHVRRLSGATFYNGKFEVFEDVVLNRLATAAWRRRTLLSNRQRRVNEPPRQPIQVVLPMPVFRDSAATGEVIDEIKRAADLALAVMHRNPYLHLVVSDYRDGSNFDVFITQPDVIEIHPGFKASVGSLTRLAQQLSDRFAAEQIREAEEPEPVSLYSLVSE